MIPKRNGKDRPLGIPTIEDRLVQQSLKLLLEAVYEKKFSKRSHGYHPNKGVHTVTKNLRSWRGISWFIEGDIVEFFDSIDHEVLIAILTRTIKDQQVIDLIWKILRAGVNTKGKLEKTEKGTPQGSIISPILSNIYLNELDSSIEELGKKKNTITTSLPNPEYILKKSQLRYYKGDKRKGYQELRKLKSTLRIGYKMYYIRYADDWLIGIWGSRKEPRHVRNYRKDAQRKTQIRIIERKN